MHVAAHGIVGFDYFRSSLLARTAGGEEEVDQHSLSPIEDIKQMDFSAVDVSCCEIEGMSVRTLRLQAKTDGQREDKGNKFFHKQ